MKDLFYDNRGYVGTLFQIKNTNFEFVEDRISKSKYGVIRGFHAEKYAHRELSCIYGKFLLITYDITTRKKQELILHENDSNIITISPYKLVAHQCLSDECIMYYKWDQYYTGPNNQISIIWNDKYINPQWENIDPILSDRDINSISLKEYYEQ